MGGFLMLVDIVFLLMAVFSWITGSERKYAYEEKIKQIDRRLQAMDGRIKHYDRLVAELEERVRWQREYKAVLDASTHRVAYRRRRNAAFYTMLNR